MSPYTVYKGLNHWSQLQCVQVPQTVVILLLCELFCRSSEPAESMGAVAKGRFKPPFSLPAQGERGTQDKLRR